MNKVEFAYLSNNQYFNNTTCQILINLTGCKLKLKIIKGLTADLLFDGIKKSYKSVVYICQKKETGL
jgi:hypothetical protein